MAGHPRLLLSLMVALAVAGALLGSATMAAAHVRPAAPAIASESGPTPAASDAAAARAGTVAAATAVASFAPTGSAAPAAAPTASSGAAGAQVAAAPTPSRAAGLGGVLILALVFAATVVAPRRVLVAALVLILAVIAVEESVHSVHHLADQRAAAHCAVAAASVHVQGATQPVAVPALWVTTQVGAVVPVEPDQPGSRSLRPDEGRAPPSA
jgi:hypothetical protein